MTKTLGAPTFVNAILESPWTWHLARVGLVSAYVIGGISKVSDIPAAIAEQEHFGFHPGWLWAWLAIIVELGGSTLVLSGQMVWLGAGALGVLTAFATFAADPFWTLHGSAALMALNTFFEHVGLIAGFVLVAIHSGIARPTNDI